MTSINEELEIELPINLIFKKTTIEDMATHIEETIKRLMLEIEKGTNS